MWKPEQRISADRRGLRYPSDVTDAEWALVAPLIRPAKRGGRPRTVSVREGLNAIFYVLWTGCQWKALPKDLPPTQHSLGVPGPVGLGRNLGYGLFADVTTMSRHLILLTGILPGGVLDLLAQEMGRIASQSTHTLSTAFLVSVAIAVAGEGCSVKPSLIEREPEMITRPICV